MRKPILLSVVAIFLLAGIAHAWERTYGGELGESATHVEIASDGGYIVGGWTKSKGAGAADFWLVKLDAGGNVQWDKTYGGPNPEYCNCICKTSDGGYIMAGNVDPTGGTGMWDVYLVKTDGSGNLEWERTFGGTQADMANSVCEALDGGYVIVGNTHSSGLGKSDLWLFKVDVEGNQVWEYTYGSSFDDYGYCVRQTSDGYIFSGHRGSPDGGWLLKADSNGDTLWSKTLTYGFIDNSGHNYNISLYHAYCVRQTSDGGYIICGSGMGKYPHPSLVVVKTDVDGEWISRFTYGITILNPIGGYSVCETADGYAATGFVTFGSMDLLLLKIIPATDTTMDTLWIREFGGTERDEGYCVQQTADGGYIVAGWTFSFGAGSSDAWLIKTDEDGNSGSGVSERPLDQSIDWEIASCIGRQIVLRYTDMPAGFHAQVFDATGRMVDEINAAGPSGTLTWGECYGCGVYFVKERGYGKAARKVILVE